jgi:hypothetical protein
MGCDTAISAYVGRDSSVFVAPVLSARRTSQTHVERPVFRWCIYGLRLRYQCYRAPRFKRLLGLVFWRVQYQVRLTRFPSLYSSSLTTYGQAQPSPQRADLDGLEDAQNRLPLLGNSTLF